MNKINTSQKKTKATTYIYVAIVALLVLACSISIAVINAKNTTPQANVGSSDVIQVSTKTYVLPMKNATISKDYSGSELQFNNTLKQWEIHKAIDFLAGDDLKVYSVSDGTITNVYTNYLEGTVIEISHGNGIVSIYKSLNKEVAVSIGEKVGAGSVIGSVAETMAQELNIGAHLHFEMKRDGKLVNPNDFIDLGIK